MCVAPADHWRVATERKAVRGQRYPRGFVYWGREWTMTDDLKDAIKDNASGPKQASVDSVRTQQHSLKEQIEADKYLAGKDSASKDPTKAFTRVKIVPPGTV